MIYIRIELWPGGNKAAARCLQEGIIHNTGGDLLLRALTLAFGDRADWGKPEPRPFTAADVMPGDW